MVQRIGSVNWPAKIVNLNTRKPLVFTPIFTLFLPFSARAGYAVLRQSHTGVIALAQGARAAPVCCSRTVQTQFIDEEH
jgi:hypothetical protein